MLDWLTSLNVAVAISTLALLSMIGRLLVEYTYIFVDRTSQTMVGISTLLYLTIFGIWIWSLLLAAEGSTVGLIALLILNGLGFLAGGVYSLLSNPNPPPPSQVASLYTIAAWANLALGLLAAVVVLLQLT
jgi:hypothetical protein